MCSGFAMLIKFDIGMSPLDAILIYIEGKFKYPYKVLKTIADVIFLILGQYYVLELQFQLLVRWFLLIKKGITQIYKLISESMDNVYESFSIIRVNLRS